MDWLQLVLPIIVGLVLLMRVLRWYLRRAHRKATEEFNQKYPGELLLKTAPANFLGLSSRGMSQIRGNGSLFLTEHKLVFKLLVPSRWIEVPVVEILSIENPRSFLGRTKGRKLLAVHFCGSNKEEDSVAWLVSDLESWTEYLSSVHKR